MGTTTSSADNNAKASISISSGNATITFQGDNSRNVVQYNSSSKLFSCYASASQYAVQIYKKVKYANSITTTTAYTVDLTKDTPDEGVILSATATDGTVYYTVKSSSLDADEYEFDDGVLLVESTAKSGVIVITAKCDETSTHKAAEDVDITVTVVGAKVDPTIAVSDDAVTYGSTYVVDTSDFLSGEVSLSSGNTAIATVEGLTITPVAVGTVTITVNTTASSMYNAGSRTFVLTVNAPAGSSTAAKSATTSTATLDFTDNSEWGFPVSSSNSETEAIGYSDGNYTITVAAADAYYISAESDGYLFLGKSGSTITFPAFDKFVTQIDVEGNSGGSGNTTMNIYVGDVPVSTEATSTKVDHEYAIGEAYQAPGNIYTFKVTNAYNAQIKSITIHFTDVASQTVTLNANGYATFCSASPIDFSKAEGYTAWYPSAITSEGVITFTKVTTAIKGGQGVLLHGDDGMEDKEVTLYSAGSEAVLSGNKFVGTTAPVYLSEVGEAYGLSGKTFVKNSAAGAIGAGKAYIPVDAIPAEVKSFTFVFEDLATGIETVHGEGVMVHGSEIYNLAGQRLDDSQFTIHNSQLKRGIYIVNGKKVLVK